MRAPFAAFGLTFAVGLILALILTPLSGWLGERLGLVAMPGGRRQHTGAVSRIGGVALYLAFVSAVLVSQGMENWAWSKGGVGVHVFKPFKTAVAGEVQVRVQVRVRRSSGEAW